MARISSPWRALRPVILAGAAAVTWLTLSSTGASADSGPDSSSLFGNVTSSVSSLVQDVAGSVSPAAPRPAAGPGLVQPVVTPVSGLADNLIAAVTVVDQVVPAGTVSAVSAPVVELADSVTTSVAQVVVAPAADALPVLEPVLQPVSDLLTGTAPLPLPLPDPPVGAVPVDLPAGVIPDSAAAQSAAVETLPEASETAAEADVDAGSPDSGQVTGGNPGSEASGVSVLAGTSGPRTAVSVPAAPDYEEPLPVDQAPLPAQVPSPASGAGSGGSSGSLSGAAAWLSPFGFGFERPGAVPAIEASEHAPAPVSFDPGSSPD
ncbi:hypothetical protein QFZ60_002974 [Arthrobacter sp. B2I5]|uniref:hypothetical protein n=1 Tax=Arthrobacter sp. B2I5 TaxID=3042266 RepID=UPI0027892B5A|nr:hypothetical protein [Arthrobacter sp. B2I5]MDQ0826801.1 hypothetical protein [Arthrobacter sp. B2I5]